MEYVPRHACEALARLQKDLRWAWNGPLNSFSIVQIMDSKFCGTPANPKLAFDEYWGYEDILTPLGELETRPVDVGPIFSRDGTFKADWNKEKQFPIHALNFAVLKWPPECVYDTGFIPRLREFLRRSSERTKEINEKRYRETRHFIDDQARENVDRLRFKASKNYDTNKIFTKEERIAALKKKEREAEQNRAHFKRLFGVD